MSLKRAKYFIGIFLWMPLLFSFRLQPVELLNIPYTIDTYMDLNSESSVVKKTDGALELSFRIGKNSKEKYAGITLSFMNGERNFSSYNRLVCTFDSIDTEGMNIIFETIVPEFTTSDNSLSSRFLEQSIELEKSTREVSLKLKEFKTPSWWYEHHSSSPKAFGKHSFKRVQGLKLENGPFSYSSNQQKIGITSLVIKYDRSTLFGISSIVSVLYLLSVYFYSNKKTIFIPYEKILEESQGNSDLENIIQFISKHYKEPGLSLSDISIKTDIPTQMISTMLNRHFDCTYRQYLNMLRMTEAQRLLKESDYRISEIAYQVGYSNRTHFNRIFREFAKTTPTSFRNDNI